MTAVDQPLVTATYWGPILGFIVGAFLTFVVERAREWFYRAKLCPDFRPDDGRCIADSSATTSAQCRWARISIVNRGRTYLRQCQAFVTNVEQEQSGRWITTDPQFIDPLALEWAATPRYTRYKPRDLPRGVEFFITIVASTASASGAGELTLSVDHLPDRLKTLFKPGHRYRITAIITGDKVKPKTISVIVNWTGNWNFDTSKSG